MRHEAVIKLYPNVHNQVNNEAYDVSGNKINLDEEKIFEEIKQMKSDHENKKYQRDRVEQYPSIEEQLDMQYHDLVNGTTTWKDAIAKVKTENPKSE